LYEGGLSIRTTLDPDLQLKARAALSKGLINYDIKRGFRGPVKHFDDLTDDWAMPLSEVKAFSDVPEWKLAIVIGTTNNQVSLGIQAARLASNKIGEERQLGRITLSNMKWAKKLIVSKDKTRNVKTADKILKVGDVVFVEAVSKDKPGEYKLRQAPEVQGALVAMDPHTGRVLAMVGGFSFSDSQFNRATQAHRQPGSSFKPFVYAAALDNGYTPSSVVLDGPIRIDQGGDLGIWEPKNYGNTYAGPSTLRLGIEKSRNLMTVRLAKDMGMPLVVEYAKRFGIYDNLLPVLSSSLGSGETTVMRMSAGYSVLANGGKQIKPSIIDRIQDRYGKTIFKHEERICETCTVSEWNGQDEPVLVDTREQVLDPMTAYQMTSMLEGVVQNGTAKILKKLGVPVAGKTGTTNEEKDAWFMGYTPDLVTGVYVGFDTPRPMGKGNTGGGLAAPIFKDFMQAALEGKKPVDFRVPRGIKLININRKTGLASNRTGDNYILEAFKPGTSPPSVFSVIGFEDMKVGVQNLTVSPSANRAILSGTGGLY